MKEKIKKNLFPESHHWCDFFEKEIKVETPRAMAILSSSILDEALTHLLKTALLPCSTGNDSLFDGAYSPLGSFSSKIDFANRMGLLNAGVTQSLHLIRKIRNDFAHDISNCSFDSTSIRSRVREIKRLNDVVKPEKRTHFPDGTVGDFQASVSWLIFWLWHIVETMPKRCPECGLLHSQKTKKSQKNKKSLTSQST